MDNWQEDLYQCIGYCQVDPDSGCCLGCGRPSLPVAGIRDGANASPQEMFSADGRAPERFPVDPLAR